MSKLRVSRRPGTDHTAHNWCVLVGDVLDRLADIPDESVHCVVTSPPYWGLRDYGVEGQIGHEPTPAEFVATMVRVFREVRRVLRSDGTCWVNLGDKYTANQRGTGPNAKRSSGISNGQPQHNIPPGDQQRSGLKPKDLCMIPAEVAIALRNDGWYLRSEIIWHKPTAMPSSVKDRCTTAHEPIYLLSKSPRYYYDAEAVKTPASAKTRTVETTPRKGTGVEGAGEKWNRWVQDNGGRQAVDQANLRSVWSICAEPYAGPHFAAFPSKIPLTCIQAGTSQVGCCPECGAGWERIVEKQRLPTRPGTATKIKVPGGWDTGQGSHGAYHRDGRGEPEYRDSIEVGNRDPHRHVTRTATTGWRPTCDCEHTRDALEPAVVFDPFLGTGTTVRAAIDLGRVGFGIELNPEYAAEAVKRITKPAETQKVPGIAEGQRDLFADAV